MGRLAHAPRHPVEGWRSRRCGRRSQFAFPPHLTLSSTLGPIGAQSPTAAEEDGVMTDQVKLDIPLLLPEVDSDADRCVARLISDLEGREGVDKVQVVRTSEDRTSQRLN